MSKNRGTSRAQIFCLSAVCFFLLVTACSPSSKDDVPSSGTSAPVAAQLILTEWQNGDSSMLAMTSGVLTKLSDGCVGLQMTDKEKPVLLRWPAGTKLSDDGKAVVGKSGKIFEFGAEVGFGGGFSGAPVPSECEASLWTGTYDVQQLL